MSNFQRTRSKVWWDSDEPPNQRQPQQPQNQQPNTSSQPTTRKPIAQPRQLQPPNTFGCNHQSPQPTSSKNQPQPQPHKPTVRPRTKSLCEDNHDSTKISLGTNNHYQEQEQEQISEHNNSSGGVLQNIEDALKFQINKNNSSFNNIVAGGPKILLLQEDLFQQRPVSPASQRSHDSGFSDSDSSPNCVRNRQKPKSKIQHENVNQKQNSTNEEIRDFNNKSLTNNTIQSTNESIRQNLVNDKAALLRNLDKTSGVNSKRLLTAVHDNNMVVLNAKIVDSIPKRQGNGGSGISKIDRAQQPDVKKFQTTPLKNFTRTHPMEKYAPKRTLSDRFEDLDAKCPTDIDDECSGVRNVDNFANNNRNSIHRLIYKFDHELLRHSNNAMDENKKTNSSRSYARSKSEDGVLDNSKNRAKSVVMLNNDVVDGLRRVLRTAVDVKINGNSSNVNNIGNGVDSEDGLIVDNMENCERLRSDGVCQNKIGSSNDANICQTTRNIDWISSNNEKHKINSGIVDLNLKNASASNRDTMMKSIENTARNTNAKLLFADLNEAFSKKPILKMPVHTDGRSKSCCTGNSIETRQTNENGKIQNLSGIDEQRSTENSLDYTSIQVKTLFDKHPASTNPENILNDEVFSDDKLQPDNSEIKNTKNNSKKQRKSSSTRVDYVDLSQLQYEPVNNANQNIEYNQHLGEDNLDGYTADTSSETQQRFDSSLASSGDLLEKIDRLDFDRTSPAFGDFEQHETSLNLTNSPLYQSRIINGDYQGKSIKNIDTNAVKNTQSISLPKRQRTVDSFGQGDDVNYRRKLFANTSMPNLKSGEVYCVQSNSDNVTNIKIDNSSSCVTDGVNTELNNNNLSTDKTDMSRDTPKMSFRTPDNVRRYNNETYELELPSRIVPCCDNAAEIQDNSNYDTDRNDVYGQRKISTDLDIMDNPSCTSTPKWYKPAQKVAKTPLSHRKLAIHRRVNLLNGFNEAFKDESSSSSSVAMKLDKDFENKDVEAVTNQSGLRTIKDTEDEANTNMLGIEVVNGKIWMRSKSTHGGGNNKDLVKSDERRRSLRDDSWKNMQKENDCEDYLLKRRYDVNLDKNDGNSGNKIGNGTTELRYDDLAPSNGFQEHKEHVVHASCNNREHNTNTNNIGQCNLKSNVDSPVQHSGGKEGHNGVLKECNRDHNKEHCGRASEHIHNRVVDENKPISASLTTGGICNKIQQNTNAVNDENNPLFPLPSCVRSWLRDLTLVCETEAMTALQNKAVISNRIRNRGGFLSERGSGRSTATAGSSMKSNASRDLNGRTSGATNNDDTTAGVEGAVYNVRCLRDVVMRTADVLAEFDNIERCLTTGDARKRAFAAPLLQAACGGTVAQYIAVTSQHTGGQRQASAVTSSRARLSALCDVIRSTSRFRAGTQQEEDVQVTSQQTRQMTSLVRRYAETLCAEYLENLCDILEEPPSAAALTAALSGLSSAAQGRGGGLLVATGTASNNTTSDSDTSNGLPRALLYVCAAVDDATSRTGGVGGHNRLGGYYNSGGGGVREVVWRSGHRARALRVLATILQTESVIEQFTKAGGVQIMCDLLRGPPKTPSVGGRTNTTDSSTSIGDGGGVNEPERREAAAVLVQMTGTWVATVASDNGGGLTWKRELAANKIPLVEALTDLLSATRCCQTLLLCAAALANVSRPGFLSQDHNHGCTTTTPGGTSNNLENLVWCRAAHSLLRAVQNRGPGCSVFLQEQTAVLLCNLSSSNDCRRRLCPNNNNTISSNNTASMINDSSSIHSVDDTHSIDCLHALCGFVQSARRLLVSTNGKSSNDRTTTTTTDTNNTKTVAEEEKYHNNDGGITKNSPQSRETCDSSNMTRKSNSATDDTRRIDQINVSPANRASAWRLLRACCLALSRFANDRNCTRQVARSTANVRWCLAKARELLSEDLCRGDTDDLLKVCDRALRCLSSGCKEITSGSGSAHNNGESYV